jgi:hypothetical protein
MVVNTPKATTAHPNVLCMVDVFSFMIHLLFFFVPLLLRSSSLFVPSSLITAQTSMPNAVAGVYLYCKQLTGEEEDDCTGYVRRVTVLATWVIRSENRSIENNFPANW